MAVRIRLTRVGATKRPSYRVIAIDKRRPRDGRALEILGFYDPLTDPATVQIDEEKVRAWLRKGAQPSETVVRLMRQAGMLEAGPAPQASAAAQPKAPRKAKPSAEPKAEATAPAEPPAAPPATSEETEPAAEPAADEAKAEA